MKNFDSLSQLGLTKSEINVYLFILESGASTPPQVARGTNITRTNCYHVLQSLKDKGLIGDQVVGKRMAYLAKDPQALFASLERKKETIEQLLPDLRALYRAQKNKPRIHFFDGLDEVREIYTMTLSAKKIYGLGSTKKIAQLNQRHLDRYMHDVKARGIVFEDILSHASGAKEALDWKNTLKGLYSYSLLPEKYGELLTDLLIWDDNIAVITLEEPIFGTVITSPPLTQTFRVIIEVLREKL